jgi:hypothetical protein
MSYWDEPPRLKEGMIVEVGGSKWRVGLVNYSRARLDPIEKVKREITVKATGVTHEVMAYPASISISPNSTCKILENPCKGRKKK